MSAYIVGRRHIVYLVESAIALGADMGLGDILSFSWYHDGKRYELASSSDVAKLVRVGQMLWDENIKSVQYRYEGCALDDLPSEETGGKYILKASDFPFRNLQALHDPYQVLKAAECYEYQSCEHPGWKTSEAKAFIDALKERAVYCLLRREETKRPLIWGAPAEP